MEFLDAMMFTAEKSPSRTSGHGHNDTHTGSATTWAAEKTPAKADTHLTSAADNGSSPDLSSDEKPDLQPMQALAVPAADEAPLCIVPSNLDNDDDPENLQRHTTSGTANETYPEGGLRAWLVVFGCWLSLVACLGLMNTLATFQSYLLEHQLAEHDEGTVGWIFSIYTFVVFFLGLYVGPMFDKYGPRWIIMAGTILTAVGLVLFSISTGESSLSLSFTSQEPPTNTPLRTLALHPLLRPRNRPR